MARRRRTLQTARRHSPPKFYPNDVGGRRILLTPAQEAAARAAARAPIKLSRESESIISHLLRDAPKVKHGPFCRTPAEPCQCTPNDVFPELDKEVSPLLDVKFFDPTFDLTKTKRELVTGKVGTETKSFYMQPRAICNPSQFMIRNYLDLPYKDLSKMAKSADFDLLLNIHPALPGDDNKFYNLEVFLQCAELSIILRYQRIYDAYDSAYRNSLLRLREPIFDKMKHVNGSAIKVNKGLQFYELFLTIMKRYAEHNDFIFSCQERGISPVACQNSIEQFFPNSPEAQSEFAAYCLSLLKRSQTFRRSHGLQLLDVVPNPSDKKNDKTTETVAARESYVSYGDPEHFRVLNETELSDLAREAIDCMVPVQQFRALRSESEERS